MDMERGVLLHLPMEGAAVDQVDWVVYAVRLAWRIWYIIRFKPVNSIRLSVSDMDFLSETLPEIFSKDKPLSELEARANG